MPDTVDSCIGKISLQDLAGSDGKDLSPEKLQCFLDGVIDLSAERHGIRPDALVKVIYDGELIVLTQEQADHLLQDPVFGGESLNELRAAVERALKGEAAFIRQELMVLIMMARMTLDRYRKDPKINQVEIARQYPVLDRTEKESNKILREIDDMSERIDKIRSQHPIIADYETKVGQMVAMQQSADLQGAKRIAMELRSKKKHYLFCCRAMEPDIKGIYFRRLDLQKIKKRLLSLHKYLLEQKVDELHIEVDSIKEKIKALSSGQAVESASGSSVSNTNTNENLQQLESMIQLLQKREDELKNMRTQNKVFEKGESKTDAVIGEITHNILKVSSTVDVSDQIADLEAQRKMRREPSKSEGPKYCRMVTLHRRKG